jgi:hypothetical protein
MEKRCCRYQVSRISGVSRSPVAGSSNSFAQGN